ncbi:MAG: hypothetical protein ABIP30_13370 [Ferruginibacter sp.]
MKKFILSIITILYLGVSSGFAMEIHYCMGKMAGVDFYKTETEKCSRCGMKAKKGCCNDEHKFYKLADAHKTIVNDEQFKAPVVFIVPQYAVFTKPVLLPVAINYSGNLSPPLDTGCAVYIRNCVFRI